MQNKKIVLVTQFYVPDNIERYQELKYCLNENIKNRLIDQIILTIEKDITDKLIPIHSKIKAVKVNKRPTYNNLFNLATEALNVSEGLMIISNSDIFYKEEDINIIYERISEKEVFALSRWNFNPDKNPVHHNTWDSQDSWIFKNRILPGKYDISLGVPGCDNKIAFELLQAGYSVRNPSKTIKSYHYHTINYSTYSEGDTVSEPYFLIETEE
jgi:hypothetical protein